MKLELKHIAPYLPYDLQLYHNQKEIFIMKEISTEIDSFYGNIVKPILRPLSDLTKEIEVNGEKFVPIDYIENLQGQGLHYSLEYYQTSIKYLPYWIIKTLLEWHFDIFGLIEQGLAIDINTLKD